MIYGVNTQEVVIMDVPLLIRVLELVKEELTSDVEIHNLASNLIHESNEYGILCMKHYEDILEDVKEGQPEVPTVVSQPADTTTQSL